MGLAVAALLAGLALSGCTSVSDTLSGGKVDYKSASTTKSGAGLDVPPDLSQLTRDSRYVVPGMAVSANAYQVTQPDNATPTAAKSIGDVRVERLQLVGGRGERIGSGAVHRVGGRGGEGADPRRQQDAAQFNDRSHP